VPASADFLLTFADPSPVAEPPALAPQGQFVINSASDS
jgi:hypothetical protein